MPTFLDRGVAFDREIEDQEYGCRDFDVRDPDGHLIGLMMEAPKGYALSK